MKKNMNITEYHLYKSENKIRNLLFQVLIICGLLIVENGCKKESDPFPMPSTVTDIDGNVYHTVVIGTQVWFAENLKTTRYRNGDTIPNISDNSAWIASSKGAYCNYDNNSSNSAIYGFLYNLHAVNDSRNLPPIGWHIPTDADWATLLTYLGGENMAGGKLKATGFTQWTSPNTGATNSSGFTGLPGGYRQFDASFNGIGEFGYWWSAAVHGDTVNWRRELNYNNFQVSRLCNVNTNGFSIRCLRDH
jgi:uncharacterized protein (TIGR02145 family)